jgi:hypothetical protein
VVVAGVSSFTLVVADVVVDVVPDVLAVAGVPVVDSEPVVPVVGSEPVVPVVGSEPVVPVVGSEPVVPVVGSEPVVSDTRRVVVDSRRVVLEVVVVKIGVPVVGVFSFTLVVAVVPSVLVISVPVVDPSDDVDVRWLVVVDTVNKTIITINILYTTKCTPRLVTLHHNVCITK